MGNNYIELTEMVEVPRQVTIDHEAIRDLPDVPDRFILVSKNEDDFWGDDEERTLASRGIVRLEVSDQAFDPYDVDDMDAWQKVYDDARLALSALMVADRKEGDDIDQLKRELVNILTVQLPEIKADLAEGDDDEDDLAPW